MCTTVTPAITIMTILVAGTNRVILMVILGACICIIAALLSLMGNSKSLCDVGEGHNTPGGCEIDGYIGIKRLSVSYEQDPIKPTNEQMEPYASWKP